MKIGIKNVVKNIIKGLFPPRCRGCGKTEGFLCECCKKYISENMRARKIDAEDEAVNEIFEEAEFLGFRDEILGEMIEEAKYYAVRGLLPEIAEVIYEGYFRALLNRGGGNLNKRVSKKSKVKTSASDIILVPMPTNRKHIRERGFDHMDRICREIERKSGGSIRRVRLLTRAKDTVQVGASEAVRRKQAKEAVKVDEVEVARFSKFRGKVILMDDVWTTGASLTEAGKMLKKAGVASLSALAITKNRTHKSPVIRRGIIS